VALNDPEKGGSAYLQDVARTAKLCIESNLGVAEFPEVKI
jgi:hypothetical protein